MSQYTQGGDVRIGSIVIRCHEYDRMRAFWQAALHYEVEHSNPNHADVEACPICGRTGDYAGRAGNLVELVHDPLGLELVLSGTIRGQRVRFEDYGQREVGSIAGLGDKYTVTSHVFPGLTGDRNTLRVGVVVITGRR